MTEKIETNCKPPKFKVNDGVIITKYNNIFSKGFTQNWSREIFNIDSVLKTNSWIYKIKDLNIEKIIGRFYKKELFLNKLWMSYYPRPNSHISNEVRVVLDLSN